MTLRQKLSMLSKKMKIIGKMDPKYKGLAMYSIISPEIAKSTFLYFMKYFKEDLSIIYVNPKNAQITWYNQLRFLEQGRAIICLDDKYMCIRQSVNPDAADRCIHALNTFLYQRKDLSDSLLHMLTEYDIFADEILYDIVTPQQTKNCSLFMTLLNYIYEDNVYASVTKAEKLRLLIGDYIYNDIYQNNRTPSDIAKDFDAYLESKEKIVYVMC
jgi:hypothetical protein